MSTAAEKLIEIAEEIERQHPGSRTVHAEAKDELISFLLLGHRFQYRVYTIPVFLRGKGLSTAFGWNMERKREIVIRLQDHLNPTATEAIRRWADDLENKK